MTGVQIWVLIIDSLSKIIAIFKGISEIKEKIPVNPFVSTHILSNPRPYRTDFVGRDREKQRVYKALKSPLWGVMNIYGLEGIGKTSLALEVVHELSEREATDSILFSGFIWISAKNYDVNIHTLLDTTARTLKPGIAKSLEVEEKWDAVIKLLQEKPCLIVVDNFESIAQDNIEVICNFLGELPERSKALLTSPKQLLFDYYPIELDPLTEKESLKLIRNQGERCGLASVTQGEDTSLLRLYKATGGFPLAIKWALGQVTQRGQSLDSVIAALEAATGTIFNDIFDRSWNLLSQHAQQLLRVMPIFVTDTSRSAIEQVSNVHNGDLDEALGQLVQMSLLNVEDERDVNRPRYSLHILTRAFAKNKLKISPEVETAAYERLSKFYGDFIKTNISQESPKYNNLLREKDNIIIVIKWCYKNGRNEGHELALAIKWFLWECGLYLERIELYTKGFKAAEAQYQYHYARIYACEIGWVYYRQGNFKEARSWLKNAEYNHAKESPTSVELAGLKSLKAMIKVKDDINSQPASTLLEDAYKELKKDDKNILETIRIMTYLGEIARDRGDLINAKGWYKETLEYANKKNQEGAIAWSLGNLAEIAVRSNQLVPARRLLEEGLQKAKEIERNHTIAHCTYWRGVLEQKDKNYKIANNYFSNALDMYQRLGIVNMFEKAEEGRLKTMRQRGVILLPKTIVSYCRDRTIWDRWEVEEKEFKNKETHIRQRELTVEELRKQPIREMRVLDLCCGTGKITDELLSLSNVKELVAVDVNPKALSMLRNSLDRDPDRDSKTKKLRVIEADIMADGALDSIGTFDVIVCIDALHHLWSLPIALSKIAKLLKADGLLVGNCLAKEHVATHVGAKRGIIGFFFQLFRAELFKLLRFIRPLWDYSGIKGYVRIALYKQKDLDRILERRFTVVNKSSNDYHWFVAKKRDWLEAKAE
jgi:SAM-dependent methyltransferase/Tfp pilus assembly protein PilF